MSSDNATESQSNSYKRVGCVKWFNHEMGYGFVTQISQGENNGEDIFVHQSNINTNKEVYRTLYDGETVMFDLQITDGDKHPYQAVNVTGYQEISLQCENPSIHRNTRRNNTAGRGGGRGNSYGGRGSGGRGSGGRGSGRGHQGSRRNDEPTEE